MQIESFTRRPFDVNAVQVTPQNAAEIAEWCGGKVGSSNYKLAGFETKLDTVLVPGNGPNKGKEVEARIGSWVVEHQGNFRVYRKKQFTESFVSKLEKYCADDVRATEAVFQARQESFLKFSDLKPGDLVRDLDVNEFREGEVKLVDQILVDFGMLGNVLYGREELQPISEYSERTKARLAEETARRELDAGTEALDKINALRAQAEADAAAGVVSTNGSSYLGDDLEPKAPVTEISGIMCGMTVEVTHEANEFFGKKAFVVGLGQDGVRILAAVESGDEMPQAVPFQVDELKIVIPELEQNDTVQILKHGERHLHKATVCVVGVEVEGVPHVEVNFSEDTVNPNEYGLYLPQHLQKI
jgi:hypothetical protein